VLKERLEDVTRARDVQRQGRKGTFRAALVGYTNAGKSSILRALATDREIFVEDRLFATLDPLTREISVDDRHKVLLTDTVGFIRKLPHHLVASFRATLEEVREADVLVHVIDASHPAWEEHRVVVDDVLHDLDVGQRPVLHAFNKMDALAPPMAEALRERVTNLLPHSIFVSALTPGGLDPLKASLLDAVLASRPESELRVPIGDGRLLAMVYREAEVLDRRAEDGVLVLRVRADEEALGRLKSKV
jgi:GTP-binding protein HflX